MTMGFGKLRVGSLLRRSHTRFNDKNEVVVSADAKASNILRTLGTLSRGLKKLAGKAHKKPSTFYQHKNSEFLIAPHGPHDKIDGGTRHGSPPSTDLGTGLSSALRLHAAIISGDEHGQSKTGTPPQELDNFGHEVTAITTNIVDDTNGISQYTSFPFVPNAVVHHEEARDEVPAPIVPVTSVLASKPEISVEAFDLAIPDIFSSLPSPSRRSCGSLVFLPSAPSALTALPAASDTYSLLEESPDHLGFLTESPCTATGTEECIIGTISDIPHGLFREPSHRRFFSGHTLVDSCDDSACTQQVGSCSHEDPEQRNLSALSYNDSMVDDALKEKNLEAAVTGYASQDAGETEDAFNKAWEAVLQSRETSLKNELADLEDEHDDKLRDLGRDHAAVLEQIEIKVQSEETKKVVLQKRVKKLVKQLDMSKLEAKSSVEALEAEIIASKDSRELFLRREELLQKENDQLQTMVREKESTLMNTRRRFQTCTQHYNALAKRYDNDVNVQNTIISNLEADNKRLLGVISGLQQSLEGYSAGDTQHQAQHTVAHLEHEVRSLQEQLSTANDNMTAVLRTCTVFKEQAQDWENRARLRAYEAERNGEIICHEQTIASQKKALLDLTNEYNIAAKALTETRRQLEVDLALSDTKAAQQDELIQRQRDSQTDLESSFRILQASNKSLIEICKSTITPNNFTTALSMEFDRMRDDNDFLIGHARKQELMIEEAAKRCACLQIEHISQEKAIEDGRRESREYEESNRMLKVELDSMELKHEMLEGMYERATVEHDEIVKSLTKKVQQRSEELDRVITTNASDQFRWQINQKNAIISRLESDVAKAEQVAQSYQEELARRQWSDVDDACISGLMERTLEDLNDNLQHAQNERDQANHELATCQDSLRRKISELASSEDQSEARRQLGAGLMAWAVDLENSLAKNGLVNDTEGYLAQKIRMLFMANDLLPEPDEKSDGEVKTESPASDQCTITPAETTVYHRNLCSSSSVDISLSSNQYGMICNDLVEGDAVISGAAGPSDMTVTRPNHEASCARYSFNDSAIF